MTGEPADRSVAIAETHIGVVIFIADRAYKLKKPVRTGFLDFSTRQARSDACHREIELNRRLSPDVYLGVADVVGVNGEVCDHLVVMRRMPAARRLSHLVRQRVPLEDTIADIARRIAGFHRTADRSDRISSAGSQAALLGRWEDSFEQLRDRGDQVFGAEPFAEIRRLARSFLAGRDKLFAARIADRRVIDGHGDLLADDIFCLEDGPRFLDCLEFDDDLRYIDGLDDIAFLAMDLERLDAPDLARLLIAEYASASGDPAPPALVEHYLAYRAFVRAKVAVLRDEQGHDNEALDRAVRDADLALRHLRNGEVALVLVGGLPGTGKSTVAAGIAAELGAELLATDELRQEVIGPPTASQQPPVFRAGRYRPELVGRVYAEMLRRAGDLLALGRTVVLDASWSEPGNRAAAAGIAQAATARKVAIECVLPADVARSRLLARRGSASEADPAIAEAMGKNWARWPEASPLATDRRPEAVIAAAIDLVKASGPAAAGNGVAGPETG